MLKVALRDLPKDSWQERRQKRHEDRDHEQGEEQFGLGDGSFQTYRTMSGASGRNRFDRRDEEHDQRDEELECLCRLVRDLELQARGRQ